MEIFEFTYREPVYPGWERKETFKRRYASVTSKNQGYMLKTSPLDIVIWYDYAESPYKVEIKEIWIDTGHDPICFNNDFTLVDNQGHSEYPLGKKIEEIFAVYNLGYPINRFWLGKAIEDEFEKIKEVMV